jgi:hypothetical protein
VSITSIVRITFHLHWTQNIVVRIAYVCTSVETMKAPKAILSSSDESARRTHTISSRPEWCC